MSQGLYHFDSSGQLIWSPSAVLPLGAVLAEAAVPSTQTEEPPFEHNYLLDPADVQDIIRPLPEPWELPTVNIQYRFNRTIEGELSLPTMTSQPPIPPSAAGVEFIRPPTI